MIEYIGTDGAENRKVIGAALDLIEKAFGPEERELERIQLCGEEAAENRDLLFTAWEDDALLSTIHLTVSNAHPELACMGGLITSPAARGRGLADELFRQAVAAYDDMGGGTMFLGTNNDMAARFYARHGFQFMTGTNVMYRTNYDSLYKFYKGFFSGEKAELRPFSAVYRIPIMPSFCARGRDVLMDSNVSAVSSDILTQFSCTGLYPRFLSLKEGGAAYGAELPTGALAAIGTGKDAPDGSRSVDGFAYPGYEAYIPQVVEAAAEGKTKLTALIAERDTEKAEQFVKMGFRPVKEEAFPVRGVLIPAIRYVK